MKKLSYLLGLFALGFQIQAWGNTLTGTISEISDNSAVEGAYVYLYNTDFIDSTDVNGDFSIDGIPNGTYTIIIDHPDFVQKVIKDFVVTDAVSIVEQNTDYKISMQCYPNPFIDNLNIGFYIAKPQKVSIEILNMNGQVLNVVEDKYFQQGKHTVAWNSNLTRSKNSAGSIYFCRIQGADFSKTNRILKIK